MQAHRKSGKTASVFSGVKDTLSQLEEETSVSMNWFF